MDYCHGGSNGNGTITLNVIEINDRYEKNKFLAIAF